MPFHIPHCTKFFSSKKAEFNWSSIQIGFIISSFSWGMFFAFIGGGLAPKYGGVNIHGFGILATGILTMLTPFLIRFNLTLFLISRICEGLTEGCAISVVSHIMTFWSPPKERARSFSLSMAGSHVILVAAYPFSGYIVKYYGWEVLFFISGGITILWFIIWGTLVRTSPSDDRFISDKERNYLINQVKISKAKTTVLPWRKILRSKPVWAYLNECFVESWSFSFVIYCIPLYVKDMTKVAIDQIGLLSGIPGFGAVLGLIIASCLVDYIRKKEKWKVSTVHKIVISCVHVTCILLLLILSKWTDFTGALICLAAFKFAYSFALTSYLILPIDLGLQYSSFIYGMGLSCLSIGYILNPIILGLIVTEHSADEWNNYFIFLAVFNIWGAIIFYKFGSGEVQDWANDKADESIKNNTKEALKK